MIATLLLVAATSPPSCETLDGEAYYRCELDRSIATASDANCEDQITQFDMNVCGYRNQLRHEIELNLRWKQVKARWEENDLYPAILAAQQSWLDYREKQCGIWAKMYEGGTIVPSVTSSCRDALTVSRISEIEKLLEER